MICRGDLNQIGKYNILKIKNEKKKKITTNQQITKKTIIYNNKRTSTNQIDFGTVSMYIMGLCYKINSFLFLFILNVL